MNTIDFDAIFAKIQETEQYTREQTINHLRRLIQPLWSQSLTAALNEHALEAIKRRLKGNMSDHLSHIRLDEVYGHAGREKAPRAASAQPLDYPRIQGLLVSFLRDRQSASLKEIRKHLKDNGITMTASQWQSMRKRFPFAYEGATWELYLAEGQRTKARWAVRRV